MIMAGLWQIMSGNTGACFKTMKAPAAPQLGL
jgi:hypothetical protein